MKNEKTVCNTCNELVTLEVQPSVLHGHLKGVDLSFEGKAICSKECGHNIEDSEVLELNSHKLKDAYRSQHNIIALDDIKKIPQMYGIGKRPLSNLLGWGELTFTRYYDGDIPTFSYSQQLSSIYNSPLRYLELLERYKDLVSTKTYAKSKICAVKLLEEQSKIAHIFDYILTQCDDITPLTIHKILYYIQGFHLAFFETDIFNEECIVTEFGPRYESIYEKYKDYNYEQDTHVLTDKSCKLSVSEKLICDSVIKNLACYSGKTIFNFISNEVIWITAMIEEQQTTLSTQQMSIHFKTITTKFNMVSALDISLYAKKMFELL